MKQSDPPKSQPDPGVSGKYIQGFGPSNAKILIVGEMPTEEEEKLGEAFSGPKGTLTDGLLKDAGLAAGLKAVYKTNVFKIRPPLGNPKLFHMLGRGAHDFDEQLDAEIKEINPVVILPLGEIALKSTTTLTKITNWRGSILRYRARGLPKVIPSLDPYGLTKFKGKGSLPWSARSYMVLDFKRALDESAYRELKLPQRLLQVCRSARQLFEFIRQYFPRLRRCSVDIESHNGVPTCVALAFNAHHAISVPLFNLSASLKIPDCELADIWHQLATLLEDPRIEIIGQNFKYDEQKLRAPVGIRCGNLYFDTSLAAHTLYPEFKKSLAFLTSIHTREPYYKDDGKDFDPKKDSGDQIYIYNARDAAVTYEIATVLEEELKENKVTHEFYHNKVNKRHKLYCRLERTGFRVDTVLRKQLQDKYEKRLGEELEELFSRVGKRFKYNAPATFAKILYNDFKVPERADVTEDTLIALLANTVKDENIRRIIELELSVRRVHKTLSTYLYQPLDGDGRMRSSFNICGTETGRRSTQVMQPPVRPFKCGWAFQTITKHGDIGSELRAMLLADEGCVIMEPDLSQAEARVVALLANDLETLKLFDTVDIHKLTAGWCFGLTREQALNLDKEDPRRFVGKTVRHAGNYGMGKHTLMLNIQTGAKRAGIKLDISEKQAGEILTKFHKYTPKIRSVFHAEVGVTVRRLRTLVNPFGRPRGFYDRFSDSLLQEAYAQIPQSTVQDQLIDAMCDFEQFYPDIPLCNEAHDAFAIMCPESEQKEVGRKVKELLERPINFANCSLSRGELIIPADVQAGPNYRDLKKIQL